MTESEFPSPPKGELALHYLGQGGFVVVSDQGTRIAVDPYLTDTVPLTRIAPVFLRPEDLSVDHVLLTHDHSDHTDPQTCIEIMRRRPVHFWGPSSSIGVLRTAGGRPDRLHRLERGGEALLGDVLVQAVHAEHTEDSVGYVMRVSGHTLYHTGDTLESDELYWLHDRGIEVVLSCFSGRWESMAPHQAAALASALRAQVVVPMHHDMFAENRADPALLVSAVASLPGWRPVVVVLPVGERWVFP